MIEDIDAVQNLDVWIKNNKEKVYLWVLIGLIIIIGFC